LARLSSARRRTMSSPPLAETPWFASDDPYKGRWHPARVGAGQPPRGVRPGGPIGYRNPFELRRDARADRRGGVAMVRETYVTLSGSCCRCTSTAVLTGCDSPSLRWKLAAVSTVKASIERKLPCSDAGPRELGLPFPACLSRRPPSVAVSRGGFVKGAHPEKMAGHRQRRAVQVLFCVWPPHLGRCPGRHSVSRSVVSRNRPGTMIRPSDDAVRPADQPVVDGEPLMDGTRMASTCPGPLRRREFPSASGLVGLGSLAWPELLRRRAKAGPNRTGDDTPSSSSGLHGGPATWRPTTPSRRAPPSTAALSPHPHSRPGLRSPNSYPNTPGRPPLSRCCAPPTLVLP